MRAIANIFKEETEITIVAFQRELCTILSRDIKYSRTSVYIGVFSRNVLGDVQNITAVETGYRVSVEIGQEAYQRNPVDGSTILASHSGNCTVAENASALPTDLIYPDHDRCSRRVHVVSVIKT